MSNYPDRSPYESPQSYEPAYQRPYGAPPNPVSNMAIISLVLGIVGDVFGVAGLGCCAVFIPLSFICGLAGGVLGYFGYQECRQQQKGGQGAAVAGMVTGGIAVFLSLAAILATLGLIAFMAGASRMQR